MGSCCCDVGRLALVHEEEDFDLGEQIEVKMLHCFLDDLRKQREELRLFGTEEHRDFGGVTSGRCGDNQRGRS